MGSIRRTTLDDPDAIRDLRLALIRILRVGSHTIGYGVEQPGWRWSTHVGPPAGTESCWVHHAQVMLSGRFAALHAALLARDSQPIVGSSLLSRSNRRNGSEYALLPCSSAKIDISTGWSPPAGAAGIHRRSASASPMNSSLHLASPARPVAELFASCGPRVTSAAAPASGSAAASSSGWACHRVPRKRRAEGRALVILPAAA